MTNRELITQLLNCNLDDEVDLRKTIGEVEFRPVVTGRWMSNGQHAMLCNRCGCRVSMKAYVNMRFCFRCGANMENV